MFFISSVDGKPVITDEVISKINSDGDETSLTISPEGEKIIFTRKNPGENSFNLYIINFSNGSWSDPLKLENLNSDSNDISPFFADNGKRLLFASNRQGSLNHAGTDTPSYDIYYSELENNEWTKPVQLFGAVNTRENEINPFIANGGNTLYFTRINAENQENSKIIKVDQADDFWSDVTTAPISGQQEIKPFFVRPSFNGEGLYFSAFIETPEKKDVYYSKVNSEGETEILIAGEKINTPDDEIFAYPLDSRRLVVSTNHGEKGNYNFIIVPAVDPLAADISEDMEDESRDKSVYFNFNSSVIKLEYIPQLHVVLTHLRNNVRTILIIHGYADGVGSHKANIDISLRRAESAKAYLVKMGIESSRIATKGHGYVKTELKHTAQYHRRVDFEFQE
jgi:outer membrane protein OmpA-like peptidoglycan-associated protein